MFERSYQCQHPHTSTQNNDVSRVLGIYGAAIIATTKFPVAVDFNDSLELVSMEIRKRVCHFIVAIACINLAWNWWPWHCNPGYQHLHRVKQPKYQMTFHKHPNTSRWKKASSMPSSMKYVYHSNILRMRKLESYSYYQSLLSWILKNSSSNIPYSNI